MSKPSAAINLRSSASASAVLPCPSRTCRGIRAAKSGHLPQTSSKCASLLQLSHITCALTHTGNALTLKRTKELNTLLGSSSAAMARCSCALRKVTTSVMLDQQDHLDAAACMQPYEQRQAFYASCGSQTQPPL